MSTKKDTILEEGAVALTEVQKRLIEKVGVVNEKGGLQPALAKILALLMVSDDPELSFDQIRMTLNISKSATSNGLNALIALNKIVYVTKFGERKRYFASKVSVWEDDLKAQFSQLSYVGDLFKEILDQRPKDTKEFNKQLQRIISFLDFVSGELPAMFTRWEKKNS